MKIRDLTKNPENPRTITEAKQKMLLKALKRFGDLSGLVYNSKSNRLVSGHQRRDLFHPDTVITVTKKYSTPTKTGTVAEGYIEMKGERFSYREVYWDDMTEKAANIAANKGAGEWDPAKLKEWIQELNSFDVDFDLDLTMFDPDEIKDLVGIEVKGYTRKNEKTGVDEDEVPDKAPARTQLGDVYILGNHRLLCGNSTNEAHVDRLLDGETVDITFTSPPYNLGSNAKLRGHNASGSAQVYTDDDDQKTSDDYLKFLVEWSKIAMKRSKYLFNNIQMLAGNKIALCEYMFAMKNNLVDVMMWDKEHGAPAMAPNCLNSAWEFVFILSNETDPKRSIKSGEPFRGTVPNIYRLNPVREGKDPLAKNHGAVFPVAFAHHFIETFTTRSVLDLFGGSGTTMIAAEKLNRRAFLMELDPSYCDVIVARWENYTGLKAKLVRTETVRKPSATAKATANGKSQSQATS